MSNRRAIGRTLWSQVPLKVVFTIFTLFVVNFGLITGGLFFLMHERFESVMGSLAHPQVAAEFAQVLNQAKWVIPAIFLIIAFLIYLIGREVRYQLDGEMTAIETQIEHMIAGDFVYRRKLRKHDELQPIMGKLHRLADSLSENRSSRSS